MAVFYRFPYNPASWHSAAMPATRKAPGLQTAPAKSPGLAADLLRWYDAHARALPWRSLPGDNRPDPYRVWLSEIMLQQTTVAAVKPYFAKFTARWPTVEALAAAEDADVMAAWAGLGYYARARNLLACARHVAAERGGIFPDSEAALRELAGIGPYTAAAIAAIAFGRRAVVVDANVTRVVARLFAIDTPLPAAAAAIRAATSDITPESRAGDFAQAMMDLGAGLCSVREPACTLCPLSAECLAFASGTPAAFPVRPAKTAKPVRRGTVFWIERGEKVWLVQRGETGMLAGMRALPSDDWAARRNGNGAPPLAGRWDTVSDAVTHAFTHFTLTLDLAVYRGKDFAMLADAGFWWSIAKLADAGLPTLFAKAAKAHRAAQDSLNT